MRCVQILDVRLGGFKTEGGIITKATVDVDDVQLWRAAYDCISHQVFHLYGFADDEEGFNSLMVALGLRLNSESDALVLTHDFVGLTSSVHEATFVRDELSLMSAFLQDYTGPRDSKAFYAAWNKCPGAVKQQLSPPSAEAAKQSYRTTFFSYGNKKVAKTSLLVRPNGTLSVSESKTLFTF